MLLTEEVLYVLKKIEDAGFEGYVVGGAVRDYLLCRKINDYDITTNAKPYNIMEIFDNTILTGVDFGTVTVIVNNKNIEVTTYRKDGKYINGRKPESIKFSTVLKQDLLRRDFTINTLCCDIDNNIIDILNSIKDVENRIIKAVGDPNERFKEDGLRMIRAVRFMTQINGVIDENTEKAIRNNIKNFENISVERIQSEFNKILMSSKPSKGIRKLLETRLMEYIIPEIYICEKFIQNTPYHNKDVLDHILYVLDEIEPKLELRLAALLHDIGKPSSHTADEKGISHFYGHEKVSADMTKIILKRLKYSNYIIDYVYTLVRYHLLKSVDMKDKAVKRYINNVGKEKLEDMFRLQIADIKGKAFPYSFEKVNVLKNKCEKIIKGSDPLLINELAVNGNDLKQIGFKEGEKIGQVLNKLMDLVLERPDLNEKNTLLDIITRSSFIK